MSSSQYPERNPDDEPTIRQRSNDGRTLRLDPSEAQSGLAPEPDPAAYAGPHSGPGAPAGYEPPSGSPPHAPPDPGPYAPPPSYDPAGPPQPYPSYAPPAAPPYPQPGAEPYARPPSHDPAGHPQPGYAPGGHPPAAYDPAAYPQPYPQPGYAPAAPPYPQPGPGYGPPYGPPPAGEGPRTHAIVALVFGVVLALSCYVTPGGVIATILSAQALQKAATEPLRAKRMIKWAWVAMGVNVGLWVAFIVTMLVLAATGVLQ